MKPVIFDTGPLVAWFCPRPRSALRATLRVGYVAPLHCPRDAHHAWARRAIADISPGGFVCESVMTEVCHLAAKEGISGDKVIEFMLEGNFRVVSLDADLLSIRDLLNRYADTPMDFTDACVTRLAELHDGSPVCTTDTDFLVFRKHRSEPIPIIAPFS